MPFDISSTHTLMMIVQEIKPLHTFLRDRYFPTNIGTDLFSTDDVLIEYRDGNQKIAPFVSPRKGGITITRDGSEMRRYTPPFIAPRRPMSLEDLQRRGFGEALISTATPQDREAILATRDLKELDMLITRREEAMAAETLLDNGCVMKHFIDDFGHYEEKAIRFFTEEKNPAVYTPSIAWDQNSSNKLADMAIMASMLTSRGLPATDLLVAPDVADSILNDERIQKLLDNRNMNIGGVDPAELPAGAVKIARLNAKGRMIDVLSYEDTYESEEGKIVQFLPSGYVVMTSPAAGRTLYGAVSQLEQSDGRTHTYTGRRIPKHLWNADNNTRSLTLTACPLMIPNHKNPWIAAKVQ